MEAFGEMTKAAGLINYSMFCIAEIRMRAQEHAHCCNKIAVIFFKVDLVLLGISAKNKVCGSKGNIPFEVFPNLHKSSM